MSLNDLFWAHIDQQLEDLKTARTAAEVFKICPTTHTLATQAAQGFFAGGGGDSEVLDSLCAAGWTVKAYDAWYYWCAQGPTGDLITYVEGDIYLGNQMLPHNEAASS